MTVAKVLRIARSTHLQFMLLCTSPMFLKILVCLYNSTMDLAQFLFLIYTYIIMKRQGKKQRLYFHPYKPVSLSQYTSHSTNLHIEHCTMENSKYRLPIYIICINLKLLLIMRRSFRLITSGSQRVKNNKIFHLNLQLKPRNQIHFGQAIVHHYKEYSHPP